MRDAVRKVGTAGLVGGACALLAPAGVAVADPKGEPFQLKCGGSTYAVVTPPGNGNWTPAFDVDSNRVFIPVVFGPATFTVWKDGEFLFTEHEPTTQVKGSGKQRDLTTCTYTFEDTFTLSEEEAQAEDLPGAGTYTFQAVGTVSGQVRGRA